MSDDEGRDGGFEAGVRWLAEQISRSVGHLDELDLEAIANRAGVDAERLREFIDGAGHWLGQADHLASDLMLRFGALARNPTPSGPAPSGSGPHPLDLPTPAQGLALSAIDSGRWTVEPGSHVLFTGGEGPAPADAPDLVGELRARDWINADGGLTLAGQSALKRWLEQTAPA